MRAILGPNKDTPIETMRFMLNIATTNAKQTKSGAGQSILQHHRKSSQSTPQSFAGYKEMQTGTGKVLDGSTRRLSTASMPADRTQANHGIGKVLKPVLASLWDTPARKCAKALSRMASRQKGITDQLASRSRKQQTTRSQSEHWWPGHQRPVRVGIHCRARCDNIHEESAA